MKQKWIAITVIFCILLLAAACLYTLFGIKEETPLIGTWNTDQSILGYISSSDKLEEVTISFYHENEGQERRSAINQANAPNTKNVPFYYEVKDGVIIVWQGTLMNTYQYSITETEETEILTLIKDDGNIIFLERLSSRPLGVRK